MPTPEPVTGAALTAARFPREPDINVARTPGATTWLNLVWECNAIDADFFTAATHSGDWWAGGTVEEYPHARIIRDDDSVRIAAKTEHGADVIARAAAALGIHIVPAAGR